MSQKPQHDDELHRLLSELVEGNLPEESFRRLDQLLAGDPSARRRYRRYLELHAMLEFEHRPEPAVPADAAVVGPTAANPLSGGALAGPPGETAPNNPLGWISCLGTHPVWLGGASLLGIALVALVWYAAQSDRHSPLAVLRPPADASNISAVTVNAGSARIELPGIGYTIVDGPAEFKMLDPMRARLSQGRARVCVTEESGHGFVVETPHGKITDLGTEFGLHVPLEGKVGLVVFDGAVDLEVNEGADSNEHRVSRFVRGEGVTFDGSGELDRINSIVTGGVATFLPINWPSESEHSPLIVSVHDNLGVDDTKKFYEIVSGGFGEDVLSYADRPHEWNGTTPDGLPPFLIGADYIKTFSNDKVRSDTKIHVALGRPATLYVIYDNQLAPPRWLKKDFRKIPNAEIGMDLDQWPTIRRMVKRGSGPGTSIDHRFDIWERVVAEPGVVILGANGRLTLDGRPSSFPYMYGIAAKELDSSVVQTDAKER